MPPAKGRPPKQPRNASAADQSSSAKLHAASLANPLKMSIPKKSDQGFWVQQYDSGVMALQANPRPGYVKAEIVAIHLPKDAPIKITAEYRIRIIAMRFQVSAEPGRRQDRAHSTAVRAEVGGRAVSVLWRRSVETGMAIQNVRR